MEEKNIYTYTCYWVPSTTTYQGVMCYNQCAAEVLIGVLAECNNTQNTSSPRSQFLCEAELICFLAAAAKSNTLTPVFFSEISNICTYIKSAFLMFSY